MIIKINSSEISISLHNVQIPLLRVIYFLYYTVNTT